MAISHNRSGPLRIPKDKFFTSWGITRLHDWEECAFFAALKHLMKFNERENDAMKRGSAIGKIAEDYVLGRLTPKVPNELANFAPQFRDARKYTLKHPELASAEVTWTFTSPETGWKETHAKDWDNAWVRIKTDLTLVDVAKDNAALVNVTDYKTGRYSPQWNLHKYLDQLESYQLGGLMHYGASYDKVEVTADLWFLDSGQREVAPDIYRTSDLPKLQKKWAQRVKPMMRDRSFRPKPSSKCRTCPYAKKAGGQCIH